MLSFRTVELSPTRCPGSCMEVVLFFSILIKHGRSTRAPSGVAPIAKKQNVTSQRDQLFLRPSPTACASSALLSSCSIGGLLHGIGQQSRAFPTALAHFLVALPVALKFTTPLVRPGLQSGQPSGARTRRDRSPSTFHTISISLHKQRKG